MPEGENKSRRTWFFWVPASVAGGLLLLMLLGVWYVRTPKFHAWLRGRVVATLEQMTGGRVELRSLTWNLARLEFEARDLTIHGLEQPDQTPYVHVDSLRLHAKLLSLLKQEIALRDLELDRPVVHLLVYADGSTNQPPLRQRLSGKSPVEQLFELKVNRIAVREGALLVNDKKLPLDFAASELMFALSWNAVQSQYDGDLQLGNVSAKYSGYPPLPASARARFSLWHDHARIDSLEIRSGRSLVQIGGQVQDFNKPVIALTYRAELEARQIGSIAGVPELRSGTLKIAGQGSAVGVQWSSRGKLMVSDMEYAHPGFTVPHVSGNAEFTIDPQRLTLRHILLSALRGSVAGEAEILQWNGEAVSKQPSPAARRALSSSTTDHGRIGVRLSKPTGLIQLQFWDLGMREIMTAISTRSLPLDRLKAAGSGAGSVRMRWERSPADFVANLAVRVTPPANPAAGELPVNVSLQGVYDHGSGSLNLAQFSVTTPASRLDTNGTVSAWGENLKLFFETNDFGEVMPLAAAFDGPASSLSSMAVHGRASFAGSVAGRLAAPVFSGRLQVSDFDLVAGIAQIGHSPVGSTSGSRRIHWDALDATVQYSPELLSAEKAVLKRDSAKIEFDGNMRLESWRLAQNSQFVAELRAQNAGINDLLGLAGFDYPVTGTLNGKLRASGTVSAPQGTGSLQLTDARIYGEPVQRVRAEMRFAQQAIELTGIEIARQGARITGVAGYDLAHKAYHFDLQGSNLKLENIRQFQSRLVSLSGALDFWANGRGTMEAPALNADVRLRDVVMNGDRVGGVHATAVTNGDTLRLSVRSELQNSELGLDGSVYLRNDFPAKLELRLNRIDVDPLLSMFLKEGITGHSALAGKVVAELPLRSPRDIHLVADIDQFSAEIENISLHNDGPIRFTWSNRSLRLEQLRVVGNDTTLAATGSLEMASNHALDLTARGQLNLKLLETFWPAFVSRGELTLDLRVGGSWERPRLTGQVDVARTSLSQVDLPNGLSDLNGSLLFTTDRCQVQNLTGKTGGGTIQIGGFVTYGHNFGLNLTAKGHDIRLRYPPGVSAVADTDLRLTGGLESALLSGDITVTRFGVNPQFDFATYLQRAKQSTMAPQSDSPLANVRAEIHVVSMPELEVQTSMAKVSGDVDLRLRGTVVHPVVLGRVNINEGEISFNGTKYRLERGGITFNNPVTIQPVLDIEATTTVSDYDIDLGFHGPMDKLSTTYRSEPPLATADIVNLLAFGQTREEMSSQTSTGMANLTPETQSILYQALNAAVTSRVQKLFGVSRIKIDPQAGGAQSNPAGPRLTIEQQVANNISITYITDVTRASYQTIQAEYNLNRNVSIVAIRDWNGVVSFDVRIRQHKR